MLQSGPKILINKRHPALAGGTAWSIFAELQPRNRVAPSVLAMSAVTTDNMGIKRKGDRHSHAT